MNEKATYINIYKPQWAYESFPSFERSLTMTESDTLQFKHLH